MANFKGRYWLTFEKDLPRQPILCRMVKQFPVDFNIRQASISQNVGLMALELEGERATVLEAIAWLEQTGVQVEPVEIQTIEG